MVTFNLWPACKASQCRTYNMSPCSRLGCTGNASGWSSEWGGVCQAASNKELHDQ